MRLHLPGVPSPSLLPRAAVGLTGAVLGVGVGAVALWRARRAGAHREEAMRVLNRGPSGRVDSAAPPAAIEAAEEATTELPPAVLDHDDLPLPDYDHLTLGSLRSRIRGLELEDLVALRTYEKHHADRLPVITFMDARIHALKEGTAKPTGNVSNAPDLASTPSKARAKVRPATGAPKRAPSTQGDLTTPTPRSAGTGSPST